MSSKVIITQLKPISQVKQIYSGRPGCACGCRGKYFYSNKVSLRKIKETKGYLTERDTSGKSISQRMIRKVYKLFQQFLNSDAVFSFEGSEDRFVILELNSSRTYTMHYEL